MRNENDARRHFLRDLGIADSAQERYIQTYVTRLTPSVEPSTKANTVPTNPSLSQDAVDSPLHMSTPTLESTAIDDHLGVVPQPAQPKGEALFRDPRSLGLLEPLPLLHSLDFYPSNLKPTFDYYGTDGTTACPIAFCLVLQNNARGYSIARLESKLLVGYQTAGNEGDTCRMLNKVLFAVLAEISQGNVDKHVGQFDQLHTGSMLMFPQACENSSPGQIGAR